MRNHSFLSKALMLLVAVFTKSRIGAGNVVVAFAPAATPTPFRSQRVQQQLQLPLPLPRGGDQNEFPSSSSLAAETVATSSNDPDENLSAPASEWTKKRLHNTGAFRSAAMLGALALAGLSTKTTTAATAAAVSSSSSTFLALLLPARFIATLHLLSYAAWFGTVSYTTFVAGITMFRNLPRQTFGKLQSKLFPKYFALSSVAIILQLITLRSLSVTSSPSYALKLISSRSIRALGLSFVMTLLNQFYLEPTSTNNMMERYRIENTVPGGPETDEYKALKSNFGKFHGMSSLANLIALCGGLAHGVYLASALVV